MFIYVRPQSLTVSDCLICIYVRKTILAMTCCHNSTEDDSCFPYHQCCSRWRIVHVT